MANEITAGGFIPARLTDSPAARRALEDAAADMLRLVETGPRPAARMDSVPSRPQARLREQLVVASRRADELRAIDRQLHFVRAPGGRRVVVEVRDLEGNFVRAIPPHQALEIATGEDEGRGVLA
jgi:uncharacterized FlaG/YvyC family protein